MLKEFMGKLRYTRKSLVVYKKTHFTLKLRDWDLYHPKKFFSIKLQWLTLQFNDLDDC